MGDTFKVNDVFATFTVEQFIEQSVGKVRAFTATTAGHGYDTEAESQTKFVKWVEAWFSANASGVAMLSMAERDRRASVRKLSSKVVRLTKSVENAEELKERFDSIFDEDLIRIITSSDIDQWSEMGWRGIMLDDGILWMDYDGKITAVNYQSKYEKKLAKKLTSKVKGDLSSDLRHNFKGEVYKFKTKNYFIRIDELKNGMYRYACWKKENPESTKPDLVLENGKIEFSGSGGNHVITFKNNIYEYKVFHNKIAASGIADITLVVEKNGKEILSEDGKLEGDTTQTD